MVTLGFLLDVGASLHLRGLRGTSLLEVVAGFDLLGLGSGKTGFQGRTARAQVQEWNMRNTVGTSKQYDQKGRTQQKSSKDVASEDCLIRRESEQRQRHQHQEGLQPKLEADCCKLLPTCW